jgi:adenylate cyclase
MSRDSVSAPGETALDAAELEALRLYDPAEEHAVLRLELLRYLVALGADADDLLAYRDSLPGLAAVLAIRGRRGVTLAEAAEQSGVGTDEIRRLARTAGFPDPAPDAPVFTEGFAELASQARVAAGVFGEDGLLQIIRVMGAAMARLADAVVSAFLVEVEPSARHEDPVGLAVARANVEATALLPMVPAALDVLLRQHLILAQRPVSPESEDGTGYETQQLVVGFADLVGSALMAERVSFSELGAALGAFEEMAQDVATSSGGRIIKLIGDEVLFVAPDPVGGCRIALELAAACERHDLLPEVRAGLARGTVMLRGGDVFGPVVNLAARVVKAARPGEVLVTADVAKAAHVPSEPFGRRRFKGIAAEVELAALKR